MTKRLPQATRFCAYAKCGKQFTGRPNKIFCSEQCQEQNRNKSHEYRRFRLDYCEICTESVLHDPCVLDVHHRDGNHFNNDSSNLITTCANHHRLLDKAIREGRQLAGLPLARYERDPNDLSHYFKRKGRPRGFQASATSNYRPYRDPDTGLFVSNKQRYSNTDDDEEDEQDDCEPAPRKNYTAEKQARYARYRRLGMM
jgi:hypothetical protein